MLTREYGELAGAGGVKDVAAQLSRALTRWPARKVSVVLPLYGFIEPESHGFSLLVDPHTPEEELEYQVDMNYVGEERREALRVWHGTVGRVNLYLLDSSRFQEKGDVYTYTGEDERNTPWQKQGDGHFDYFAMNLLLQKGALHLMVLLQQKPDVIHCHDGHTAVLPAIIHENLWLRSYFRNTGCVVTIHNAGRGYHQEVADLPFAHAITGLPWQVIMKSRLQGSFDPLVAAGHYAVMNTVSENYAIELQETLDDEMTGWLGHHLKDMGVKLEGITNGIDPADFNPAKTTGLGGDCSFNPLDDSTMKGKDQSKKILTQHLSTLGNLEGVEQHGVLEKGNSGPLFTFIGRLSEQKGVDILLGAIEVLFERHHNCQVVILGNGGVDIESELAAVTGRDECKGLVSFLCGYSPNLANRLYSAGDFFLIPSRYEPCGLTDFIAQLFGNLPIVHYVGGLVKVVDGETGFSYTDNSPTALARAMERAMEIYKDQNFIRKMQKKAVEQIESHYTWKTVVQHYLKLYKKSLNQNL